MHEVQAKKINLCNSPVWPKPLLQGNNSGCIMCLLVCGLTYFVGHMCETNGDRYKKNGGESKAQTQREREKETEVHLFDTESLRKCRGMSRTPVCAWLCVFVH